MVVNKVIQFSDATKSPTKSEYFSKYIMYIRVIFGYNYLPIKSNRFYFILLTCYCICICMTTSVYILCSLDGIPMWSFVFVITEYIITVLVSCFTKFSHRLIFFDNVSKIDVRLNVQNSHYKKLHVVHNIISILAIVSRVFYAFSFCICFHDACSPVKLFISSFVSLAVDINHIPRVIVFYISYYHMKLLRQNMENKVKIVTVDGEAKSNQISHYLDTYKCLLNNMDAITVVLNPLYFLSLVCSFPKIMIMFYNILSQSKTNVPVEGLIILTIEGIQWGVLPCLPGVVAEKVAAEVDKIKVYLMEEILNISDPSTRVEYQDFINYVEIRPFKYSIWRVVPVDMRLPIGMLSLCTTYFIVIIQFTHLFG